MARAALARKSEAALSCLFTISFHFYCDYWNSFQYSQWRFLRGLMSGCFHCVGGGDDASSSWDASGCSLQLPCYEEHPCESQSDPLFLFLFLLSCLVHGRICDVRMIPGGPGCGLQHGTLQDIRRQRRVAEAQLLLSDEEKDDASFFLSFFDVSWTY